jgi:hypothetical protein
MTPLFCYFAMDEVEFKALHTGRFNPGNKHSVLVGYVVGWAPEAVWII